MAYDASNWQAVNLPHDWSIGGPFDQEAAAGGGGAYLPDGDWVVSAYISRAGFIQRPTSLRRFRRRLRKQRRLDQRHWLGKRPFGYIGFSTILRRIVNAGGQDDLIAVRTWTIRCSRIRRAGIADRGFTAIPG